MRKGFYFLWIALIALTSCKDNDVNVFDKTADERASEAIASLKADLIAPPNGWRVKYKPTPESGSFYVLLNFKEDNQLIIRSDLASNNGKYVTDTLTYRIDNSLGLELIFETYSFFSYLFEQRSATFEAEYEFNYVNKTPDNALVFQSKTDASTTPTVLVFEEASAADEDLLGIDLAKNLDLMSNDLDVIGSSYKITFQNKDLILYASLDPLTRVMEISSASKKSNVANSVTLSYSSSYLIQGDLLVLDTPFQKDVLGSNISFENLKLNALAASSINVCVSPIPIHSLSGTTSANDNITLEPTYTNLSGNQFILESNFYFMPLVYVSKDGESAKATIEQDIEGALEFDMIYDIASDDYRIGFFLLNADGTYTFAYREFAPVLNGNVLTFNLKAGLKFGGTSPPDADPNQINAYIDALTAANTLYVLKISSGTYEFTNPCTGWSFIGINAN